MSNEAILVVEDEGIAAMNLERKIEHLGYRSAGIAYTGEEAVDRVRRSPPDLILMDIKLAGDLDGIQAGQIIQREHPVPIVYISAFSDESTIERAKESAPFGYLTKPLQEPSIRTTIEMALNKFRLERRLKESEQDFRTFFEMSPVGAACVAAGGRITRGNQALARLLGYDSPAELSSVAFAELFVEEDRSRVAELRAPARRELRAYRKGREVIWVEVAANDVHEAGTGNALMLCLFMDISVRKALEQDLEARAERLSQSNRKLEEFTSIASHDLKAPARRAALFIGKLSREYDNRLDARAQEYLGFAVAETKKMQSIVDDLLEYSYVSHAPPELKPISLLKIVGDTIEILRPEIEAKHARITYDLLPTVRGNEIQLRRLFANLISNALKYNRGKPRIHVSASPAPSGDVVTVTDNGIGIPAEDKERIFEVFHRGHSELEFPGTGIGLASCRRITENHGGKIWVESELGKGSTFFISFPK